MHAYRFIFPFMVKIFLVLGTLTFVVGCKKEYKPEESFIKIYDDQDGSKDFHPLSMKRTSDDGFLILSAFSGCNIQLLKIDKTGEFVWNYTLPSNFVNAAPSLIEMNGEFYFACMDGVGLFTYMMKIDENSRSATEIQQFNQIIYPTALFSNGTQVYLQNYNRLSYETGIYELSPSLTEIAQEGKVNVLTSVEDKLVDHINFTGKRFPFFIQTTGTHVVMSGFFNYSFSLVFLDQNLDFTGVYNGSNFTGGLNSLLPLGSNNFAVARFSGNNLFFNPFVPLEPTAIDIAENIPAMGMAEIDAEKPVLIRAVEIKGKKYLAFLSTTESNQIRMQFFDRTTGTKKGEKYIGQSIPLSSCDLNPTNDGGLIVLVQAKIMGSYNRIATVKFSEEQLLESIE